MNKSDELPCYFRSKHEATHIPFQNIVYIFCSKNGKIIVHLNDKINYSRRQLSSIVINDDKYFANFKFEIYHHKELGKIISKENSALQGISQWYTN